MSLKKILFLPTSKTQSKHGKGENGNRLFTTRDKKEESDKTDEDSSFNERIIGYNTLIKAELGNSPYGKPTKPILLKYFQLGCFSLLIVSDLSV